MRHALLTLIMTFTALFGVVSPTYAESPTAANIFGTLGGTTTLDQGGAVHSQTRSIYSMGGGMASFNAKRITLLAADPPSFSAGCSGISWHFGGFSFISVDEIRQLVEAVSQASLGIAVDLAMQTLCPQCYAVMSKLRDISNAMRNAAADSCKIAKNFGALLKDSGVFPADKTVSSCSEVKSETNESSSWLHAGTGVCKTLNGASQAMTEYGTKIQRFLNGDLSSGEKTPSKDKVDEVGNATYKTLRALGYKDGFVMNFLVSYTGMTILTPHEENCSEVLSNIRGTAQTTSGTVDRLFAQRVADASAREIAAASAGAETRPQDGAHKRANPEASGARAQTQVCHAPAVTDGLKSLGKKIICGMNADVDAARFKTKFGLGEKFSMTSLGALCKEAASTDSSVAAQAYTDYYIYDCSNGQSKDCMTPKLVKLQDAVNDARTSEYTGLVWMVMDALHQGVRDVMNNDPLKPDTLKILNGSGYPLYRLVNLAAVYPGMADELLMAYGSIIATHYAIDTLDKLVRPGNNTQLDMQGGPALPSGSINDMRWEIMNMLKDGSEMREEVMKRLSEKRALIDLIVQINRSLQAEVISQGLMGNANLAVSLKKQQSVAP